MKLKTALVVLTLLSLVSPPLQSDTSIHAYGLVISSTAYYGPYGSITQFNLLIEQPDGTGYYTYICRRPNLGPCANIQINRYVEINALLVNSCNPNFICGEGLITTLSYVD